MNEHFRPSSPLVQAVSLTVLFFFPSLFVCKGEQTAHVKVAKECLFMDFGGQASAAGLPLGASNPRTESLKASISSNPSVLVFPVLPADSLVQLLFIFKTFCNF